MARRLFSYSRVVFICAALIGATTALAATKLFIAASSQNLGSVSNEPHVQVLADVNADNKLDAVSVDSKSNELVILLNTGSGSFQAPIRVAAGANPSSAAIGDVTGDGVKDVVVANAGDNTVKVFQGNNTGNFTLKSTLSVGGYPVMVRLISVNYTVDNYLDVVAVNRDGHSISVLLGTGGGNFAAPITTSVAESSAPAPSPVAIAFGDFNGDGKWDIATANSGQDYVSYLFGNGNGTFGTVQAAWVEGKQFGIFARDVNLDGRNDLLASVRANGASKLVVLKNKAQATLFPDYETYFVSGLASQLRMADYNGDGYQDVLVGHENDGRTSLLRGTKSGTFSLPEVYTTNFNVDSFDVADVTGDKYPDLVIMGDGGTISTHQNAREFVVLASDNPYQNNVNEVKTYTFPEEVDAIEVYFSVYTKLGAGDTLSLSEPNGTPLIFDATKNFSYYGGLPVTFTGNKAIFQLTSDAATTDHGYSIIAVKRALDTDGDGKSDILDSDDDNDGLLDTQEDVNGNNVVDAGETNAKAADSDGDGLDDFYELNVSHTSATTWDTDGDGAPDGHDADPNSATNNSWAATKAGIKWLLSNQNPSGSWGSGEREVLATTVALDILRRNDINNKQYAKGLAWLGNSPNYNNDYLARKMVVLKSAGIDVKSLVTSLMAQRITRTVPYLSDGTQVMLNFDGWGTYDKYDIGFLETGRAMWGLFYAQEPVTNIVNVYNLIIGYQNQDGGWGMSFNRASDIHSTASIMVPLALQPVAFKSSAYNTNIKNAVSWILSKKQGDNGFGVGGQSTVQETAIAMEAVAAAIDAHNSLATADPPVELFNTTEMSSLTNTLTSASIYLLVRTNPNGSWNNDTYLTALALSGLTYGNGTWDTDGDGIADRYDTDRDGDGVADSSDAFPLDRNEWLDTDGDGTGNNADLDDDGDGVLDAQDAFPLNPTEWSDTDGDGIGDNADPDDDNDGIPDGQEDSNQNGVIDANETDFKRVDTDGDGYSDAIEVAMPGANALNSNIHPNSDFDQDGFTPAQGDWNDTDATLHPGAPEICGDGIDQNGDGVDLSCAVPDGDLNGDSSVDVADVALAERIALGLVTPTPDQLIHADVAPAGAPNGSVDAADVSRIRRKALGLESF